jgi:hypothetical protein
MYYKKWIQKDKWWNEKRIWKNADGMNVEGMKYRSTELKECWEKINTCWLVLIGLISHKT